jgi:LysM repeat protein
MVSLALILVASTLGISAQPAQAAQAATCARYHRVVRGESLSVIGSYYGVRWQSIATANNIRSPYTIYPRQLLCIPSGQLIGGGGGLPPQPAPAPKVKWSFSVIGVNRGKTVTIQTANFPDNMLFQVDIGCWRCDSAPIKVGEFDSDAGGRFKKVFDIPAAYAAGPQLLVRVTQMNKGKRVDVVVNNVTRHGLSGGARSGRE